MEVKPKQIHKIPDDWWECIKTRAHHRASKGEVKGLRGHLIDVLHKDLVKSGLLKPEDKPR